jgi:hypothetical protein
VLLALTPTLLAAEAPSMDPATNQPAVIVVVGAPGENEYLEAFAKWAAAWRVACTRASTPCSVLGTDAATNAQDLVQLRAALAQTPKESLGPLWLVLLGHGTFDGKEGRFNLRGPDLTATELAELLGGFRRPVAVVVGASSSGPFLQKLSAPGRVVITACRSGYEQNYARFGGWLAEAIADPQADLDRDGQTSLLEAFLMASRRVAEFYASEGRLATEHALLDDNGDGRGTPADWFRGIRAVKKAADGAALDGPRAHQFHLLPASAEAALPPETRARRDALELALERLRERKSQLSEDLYYEQLERLLVELAALYQR